MGRRAQAMPSLLFAAVGSTLTGTLFGVFQVRGLVRVHARAGPSAHPGCNVRDYGWWCMQEWTAFKEVPELFILVPILFNLKGNLEMNLASRLSTAVRSSQHAHCAPRRGLTR